jgi:hypothetical protein
MKLLSNDFFTLFLIFTIVSISVIAFTPLGLAQNGSSVGGIISSDSTWTKSDSPYSFTANVLVENGVTLTIDAGVVVNLNSYYILVNGTLRARGNQNNPIYFNNGINNYPNAAITFGQGSVNWNQQTGLGSIIENAVLNSSSIQCQQGASPKINNDTIYGEIGYLNGSPIISNSTIFGLISDISVQASPIIENNVINGYINDAGGGSSTISGNTIFGGIGSDQYNRPLYQNWAIVIGGGIGNSNVNNAYIANNTIYGFFTDAAISVEAGTPNIIDNSISNTLGGGAYNYGINVGIKVGNAKPMIKNNTITQCAYGITTSSTLTISYNNIFNNSLNIKLMAGASGNVTAAYNWWGTTDTQAISKSIYDFKNDFNLGNVNFLPILTSPNLEAHYFSSSTSNPANQPSSTPSTMPTQTPSITTTPTVPELSWLAIIPLMVSILFIAITVRLRKTSKVSVSSAKTDL